MVPNAYELLFNHVENMVCTLDLDGCFTSINPAGEHLTGYSAEELLGLPATDLVASESRSEAVERFRRRLRGEAAATPDESVLLKRDGTCVPIEVTSTLFLEDDRLSGVLAVVHDLSERKHAQEALLQSERRFRKSFESAAIGIALVGTDGRFIEVNDSLCKIVGYPADILVTKTFQEITHPDDLDVDLEYVGQVISGAIPSYQMEKRYFHAGGDTVWVLLSVSLVRAGDGTPLHFVSQIEDITQRKHAEAERDRLQEQLHHAQKLEAVGRLAGGIAHDFNNMLTGIRGYTELLLDRLDPASPLRAEAEQIKRAAEQASNLPKQLLAFSREQVLEPSLVDLDAVVAEAVGLVRRLVGDSVEVVVLHEATAPLLQVDATELEQLLLNLAVNAGYAMPEGGRLVIRTANEELDGAAASRSGVQPGRFVVLSVEDFGVGMDPDTKARAFEPFFTTKPQGEGSGLGLAGVYGVVTQSGGFVRLDTAVGAGSTFRLYFPSADAAVETRQRTVLVAEDEEIVRDLVQLTLERAGYRVLAAADADEALRLRSSSDGPVDLLLTDMVMPGMNGAELAQRVLADSPGTPVVFMSGYTSEAVPVASDGGNVGELLEKPFPMATLVERVQAALATVGDAPDPEVAGPAPSLTDRERQVLALVADGYTNERAAVELGITGETVQTHVRNVMGKLDADSRTQAVATALRHALID
jgi:two-component system, cell cycle sensor histidine kinase and response regulator CckA